MVYKEQEDYHTPLLPPTNLQLRHIIS